MFATLKLTFKAMAKFCCYLFLSLSLFCVFLSIGGFLKLFEMAVSFVLHPPLSFLVLTVSPIKSANLNSKQLTEEDKAFFTFLKHHPEKPDFAHVPDNWPQFEPDFAVFIFIVVLYFFVLTFPYLFKFRKITPDSPNYTPRICNV